MAADAGPAGLVAGLAAGILAGGAATRLGGVHKPLLVVGPGGARIIDRQLAALGALTAELWLSTHDPAAFADLGLPTVSDGAVAAGPGPGPGPGKGGPLAGLAALLAAIAAPRLLLVAGDMPELWPPPLRVLCAADPDADIVAPVIDGRAEPLCAVYHRRVLPVVLARLAAGRRKAADLLEDPALRVCRLPAAAFAAADPALRFLRNVNSPADLSPPPL